jgi:hypothetical protein
MDAKCARGRRSLPRGLAWIDDLNAAAETDQVSQDILAPVAAAKQPYLLHRYLL